MGKSDRATWAPAGMANMHDAIVKQTSVDRRYIGVPPGQPPGVGGLSAYKDTASAPQSRDWSAASTSSRVSYRDLRVVDRPSAKGGAGHGPRMVALWFWNKSRIFSQLPTRLCAHSRVR